MSNSGYESVDGKCLNCKDTNNLYEQDEKLFDSYGTFDLYGIRVCVKCGYWFNNVCEGFFTKEEMSEL